MRKIVVKFNKLKDIENLKKIMRNVYASSSDHLPDIAKFHLGDKIFIPNQVDKAELHITTANGTEIIAFSKAALSFYLGSQHPFTEIAMTSENEGNYIVLPWNLDNRVGRDNLKNLINRIPNNVRELKYIIYVKDYDNLNSLSLESSKDLSQSLTSLASLHLSDIAAEDETEGLLNKIDNLEQSLRERDNVVNQKQAQINSLTTQVNNMSSQVSSLTTQNNNNSQIDSLITQMNSKDSQINSKDSQIANLTTRANELSYSNYSYSNQIKELSRFKNNYDLINYTRNGDSKAYLSKAYKLINYSGTIEACADINPGGGAATVNVTFDPSW